MIQHEKAKQLLVNKPGLKFVEAVILLHQPWSAERGNAIPKSYYYRVFNEFPCSEGVWSHGKGVSATKRADALINVSLKHGALFYQDDFHVLVEIKESKQDLRKSLLKEDYFAKYEGISDFLYLAVTPELVEPALDLLQDNVLVGLFDITTGKIYKLAHRQSITDKKRLTNYRTMVSYYRSFPSVASPVVSICLPAISLGFKAVEYKLRSTETEEDYHNYFKLCYEARRDIVQNLSGMPSWYKLKYYYTMIESYVNDKSLFSDTGD